MRVPFKYYKYLAFTSRAGLERFASQSIKGGIFTRR